MKNVIRIAAAALAVTLSTAAPSRAGAPAITGKPIKVGAISTLTTAAAFPQSVMAAKAFFDQVNGEGGIRGRKLVLVADDDKGDPKLASAIARRLVENEGVVAMVSSASAMECSVNAAYYMSKGIAAIQGTGVDPACFNSPNISPVNTGPYIGLAAALQFASEVRGKQKICAILMDIPGMGPEYEKTIASWKRHFHKQLHLLDREYPLGSPTAPYVKKVLDANCDAAVFLALEPDVVNWVGAVKATGREDVDWLFLTPAYTADVARKAGATGDGMFAMSEFLPWSSRALDLTDWRETMNKGKVPLTSFSQGGYLAAQVFVSVLRRIPGEITRESVLDALRKLERYESPLIGTPYSFGDKPRHNANHAIIPMVLREGQWRVAHPDWIVVPTN